MLNRHGNPEIVYEDFIAQESIELSVGAKAVPVNKAEMCRIVVETLGIYDEFAESNFTDVPVDSPYYHYISSAVQAKLVQGHEDRSFGPYDPVPAGMYSILILERALGVYKVSDWSNLDRTLRHPGAESNKRSLGRMEKLRRVGGKSGQRAGDPRRSRQSRNNGRIQVQRQYGH